jgi:hypothetical protein
MAVAYNAWITPSHIYQHHGGSFGANRSGQSAFDYFPDAAAVGDALYFGHNYQRFDDIQVYVGTAFAAGSVTFVWEYWNGSAWVALTVVDGTNGWADLGQRTIAFVPPIDWNTNNIGVGGGNFFWVRCRISAVSGTAEGGANSTQTCKVGNNTLVVTGGSDAARNIHQDLLSASLSNGWGIVSGQGALRNRRNFHKGGSGNNTTEFEQYFFNCYLDIGDGVTATYFGDEFKQVSFVPCYIWWGGRPRVRVRANAHYRLGRVTDASKRTVIEGCSLFFGYGVSHGLLFETEAGGTTELLASMITMPSYRGLRVRGKIWSCVLTGAFCSLYLVDCDVHDISVLGVSQVFLGSVTSDIDNAVVAKATVDTTLAFGMGTYSNLKVLDQVYALGYINGWDVGSLDFIDCALPPVRTFRWNGSQTYSFPSAYEKYSFLLEVNNGAGGTVTIKDKNGNPIPGSPFTLDAQGKMSATIVANKYDRDPSVVGTYTEVTIATAYNPYTFIIEKPGYQTYEGVLTIDRKMELAVAMSFFVPKNKLEVEIRPSSTLKVELFARRLEVELSG